MKRIGILLFLYFFFIPISQVYAIGETPSHILFINQVRGSECCSKGVFKHLEMQTNAFIENQIPAYFAIRYDALNEIQYSDYLRTYSQSYPDIIHLGLLLEVTPSLAKAAGVPYHATPEKWYEAHTVYSIGYTDEENKKMMDVLFEKFYEVFGYYPALTSAWMIEANTLNYIQETYGVTVHQITREQWGTDSYTLSGGVPHYPYPASSAWAFLPDYERENAPLIVRQTVMDPLQNYGDMTNAFTSQPNDYAIDEKKFEYFELLLKQAVIEQPQEGFALLGLETSMFSIYQDEYMKQIEHVKKLYDDGLVVFPDLETLSSFWKSRKSNMYWGKDLTTVTPNEAYWFTTPYYRMRLRRSGNSLFISDIRYFQKTYYDPYSRIEAHKEGFWIMPYFVDGSLWYALEGEQQSKHWLSWLYSEPEVVQKFPPPSRDMTPEVTSIVLPDFKENSNSHIRFINNTYHFKYTKENGEESEFIFNADTIVIKNLSKNEISLKNFYPSDHPIIYKEHEKGFKLSWMIENKEAHVLDASCNKDCIVTFTATEKYLDTMRETQYPFLFPEPIPRKLNKEKTVIHFNNYFAVGSNPVRIVVIPYDIYGSPTILANQVDINADKEIDIKRDLHSRKYFIDLTSAKPTSSHITISLDDSIKEKASIYFSPNCKDQWTECLLNPIHTYWYLNSVIRNKIRWYLKSEIQ